MPWVYLSHVLDTATPVYSGASGVRVTSLKSMGAGDSCNESKVELPLHAGSHVDAPRHFDETGLTIDEFPADFWHVTRICLLEVNLGVSGVIDLRSVGAQLSEIPANSEMILIRTGFERHREINPGDYIHRGPCIGSDFARWLRSERRLRFIGTDAISISSPANREEGRLAHRALLGSGGVPPVLILEDLHLAELPGAPLEAWIVPIRVTGADGAPVTIAARLG